MDHISTIKDCVAPPKNPSRRPYGIDSSLRLVISFVAATQYLYTSLQGKHYLRDELLSEFPINALLQPTLEMGYKRGMVLLKVARLKEELQATISEASS